MSPSDLLDDRADDIDARSRALEELAPQEILQAAIDRYRDRALVSTAFGASGLCVMHMAQAIDPVVRCFTIDTGFTFAETMELMRRWVDERQLNLEVVHPLLSVAEQSAHHGEELWRRDPDLCCRIRKVEPNERTLKRAALWITALRRDESPSRSATPILERVTLGSGHQLLKLAPIARWTPKDVWRYIVDHELPYNPLHDVGYPSVGCTHCTKPVADGQAERSGRWEGTAKQECGLHVHPERRSG